MLLHGQKSFKELPDSLRLNIRIHSHLLITQKVLSTDFTDQFNGHVPFAFKVEDILSREQEKVITEISQSQKYTLLISPEPQTFKLQGKNLIFINSNDVDIYSLSRNEEADPVHHQKFTTKELLFLELKNVQEIQGSIIFKLWERTGKLPNFIKPQKEHTSATIELIKQLNSTRKIYGIVHSGDQLLKDVSWKEYPDRKTNGYFCFPDISPISPYKPGYQFSPDIIFNSPSNWNKLKEFKAIKLNPGYLLNDHFSFDKEIKNLKRDNEDEILNNRVELVKDKTRGVVACFSGGAYIDGGIQSRGILKSNFSVTAWIKPTKLGVNNSILGKGKNFVFKILNGKLTYTMQGVYDYSSENAKIPIDQWTFISIVHSAYDNQMRYYLNGELVDRIDLIKEYEESDYTLLIGSNLWEQFFVGYMDDIKIWERELNDDEIREQFNLSSDPKNRNSLLSSFLLFAVFAAILFFILSKKFRKKSGETNLQKEKPIQKLSTQEELEKILCFGGLQVINREGSDVAQNFSPKLKQLFVLIFLYSIDGQKGISSGKLSGYLWPGMNPKNVKNTRGTNIQKLKAALEPCSEMKLVFKDKHWLLEMTDFCYSDYSSVLQILNSMNLSDDNGSFMKQLPSLMTILKRGTLFPNMSESWIDNYSSNISDQIIELGLALFKKLDDKKDASSIYELAEVISIHDPLNEPALRIKLSLLTKQGKLGLARSHYDSFTKLYSELYQEEYTVAFKTITHSTSEKK